MILAAQGLNEIIQTQHLTHGLVILYDSSLTALPSPLLLTVSFLKIILLILVSPEPNMASATLLKACRNAATNLLITSLKPWGPDVFQK